MTNEPWGRGRDSLRIVLITGGSTPERDVALAGAGEVMRALRVAGHRVVVVDTASGELDPEHEGRALALRVGHAPPGEDELARLREREDVPGLARLRPVRNADLAFLVLHGLDGEGGLVQAVLELAGLPYTGSDLLGSALAMAKGSAKRVLQGAGIPTPRFVLLEGEEPGTRRDEITALGFPLIVKPSRVGSSVGLRRAKDFAAAAAAVRAAGKHDRRVLVEEMLPGREFTVGVLGDASGRGIEPLGVGEIVTPGGLFDYHAKYTPGIAEEIFPAPVSASLAAVLQDLAVATHRALGLRDFSRVDFRLDARGAPSVLEANTLPGMTTRSLLPQSAAVTGLSFPDLCDRIARLAARRI